MENILEAREIKKTFGDRAAIAGLDMDVPGGKVFGLLGPNGAGKTTLIRILCGLLRPDEGEVRILGWKVPSLRISSQIGYMPQEIALYDDLTVMQNLRFFGDLYDLPHAQTNARADDLLELVQLSDRKRQRVGTLSGGMQRRVSLVASLLHKPRLVFLDEPTAGVDPRLRRSFWDYFLGLTEDGVTVFVTTHLMEEATRCHVVSFLNQGMLIAQGSPDDLRELAGTDDLETAFIQLEEKGGGE